MKRTATFSATLDHLPLMLDWVRERLHQLSIEPLEKNRFEVAAEEILVNIISHAYRDYPGTIEMVWTEEAPLLFLTFKDFGKPFNPLHHQDQPNYNAQLEHRNEGGLGIFFVKNFVDDISYRYVEGANILTITKRLH